MKKIFHPKTQLDKDAVSAFELTTNIQQLHVFLELKLLMITSGLSWNSIAGIKYQEGLQLFQVLMSVVTTLFNMRHTWEMIKISRAVQRFSQTRQRLSNAVELHKIMYLAL
jgi:hypothetical protein